MIRFFFGLVWRLLIAAALVVFGLGLCVLPEEKQKKTKRKKPKSPPKPKDGE